MAQLLVGEKNLSIAAKRFYRSANYASVRGWQFWLNLKLIRDCAVTWETNWSVKSICVLAVHFPVETVVWTRCIVGFPRRLPVVCTPLRNEWTSRSNVLLQNNSNMQYWSFYVVKNRTSTKKCMPLTKKDKRIGSQLKSGQSYFILCSMIFYF